jgi:hypothetical protein
MREKAIHKEREVPSHFSLHDAKVNQIEGRNMFYRIVCALLESGGVTGSPPFVTDEK